MARPRVTDRKDIRLTARFTQAEADVVSATATRAGLTVSDLLRYAVLDEPPPPARRRRFAVEDGQELAKVLAHIGRIGSNVNQLARVANMGGWPEAQLLSEACADIQRMRFALMLALGVSDPGPEVSEP